MHHNATCAQCLVTINVLVMPGQILARKPGCCGMKPLFQIHFQSILAQYSFPVSILAISFTLPSVKVAYQVNNSERAVSVPHQRTDSAYPEVISHEFTERQTPQPTQLSARKTKSPIWNLHKWQKALWNSNIGTTLIQGCRWMFQKHNYESLQSNTELQQAFGWT